MEAPALVRFRSGCAWGTNCRFNISIGSVYVGSGIRRCCLDEGRRGGVEASMGVMRSKRRSPIRDEVLVGFHKKVTHVARCACGIAYLSGSESSVNKLMTSVSGGTGLLLDVATEIASRDPFEGISSISCSVMMPGTAGTSGTSSPPNFWFFFLRRRREPSSLENPLEPAFAESPPSLPWVLGLSDESIDERPLLFLLAVSIVSDSDTVQARLDRLPAPPFKLEDDESAMVIW